MNLLIPIDFSDITDQVLATAVNLATLSPSTLRLLHVADPDPDFVGYEAGPQVERNYVSKTIHEDRDKLHLETKKLEKLGLETTSIFLQGPITETILKESIRHKTDYIIIGSHGHGAIYNLVVGSIAEGVLRKSQCPIIVVPMKKNTT